MLFMGKLKLVNKKSIYLPSFKISIHIINVLETKCGRLYSFLLPAFEFLTTAEVINGAKIQIILNVNFVIVET